MRCPLRPCSRDASTEALQGERRSSPYLALCKVVRFNLTGRGTFIRQSRPVIEKLKGAGLRFGHHNHSHEFFRPERGGPTLEDVLIDEGGPDLFLELELYWIEHAGYNCARILERCSGRVPVIHLKDKEVLDGKNETRMAPIGEGNMDWDGIISAWQEAGVRWYAVEQDQCFRDPFDCLRSSYKFLRSKGL